MLLRHEEGAPLMKNWTARLELDTRAADLEHLDDVLTDYHAVRGVTLQGRAEVVMTVGGESLRHALVTAISVLADVTGFEIYAVEVMPTEEFESRRILERVPQLLSVSEAAVELGVSPQAIRQRLDTGTMAGTKIGSTWAIPRVEVRRLKAASVPSPTPSADRISRGG
jgi:excisionase family DNA binding protein